MQMLEGELLTQPEEMSMAAFAAWSEVSTDDCGHLRYNHDLLRRMIAMARIFLCHASEDKPQVREVYQRLGALGFEPWLDEVEILPGQD
jgi:hypothetical protein